MVLAPRLLEFDFAVPPPPVPDQPGGVAKGETVEETERLLREVIELHVARQREDGLVVPDPSRVVDSVGVSA